MLENTIIIYTETDRVSNPNIIDRGTGYGYAFSIPCNPYSVDKYQMDDTYINPWYFDPNDPTSVAWGSWGDDGTLLNGVRVGFSLYPIEEFDESKLIISDADDPAMGAWMTTLGRNDYSIDVMEGYPGIAAIRRAFANSSSGTLYVYFYGKSVNGNTYLTYNRCTYTLAATDNGPLYTNGPDYVVTDELSNTLTGDTSTIIRYISDVNVTFSLSAKLQAGLHSYTIKNGTQTVNIPIEGNPSTATITQAIADVDSPTFYVTAIDSRGFSRNNFAQATGYIEYYKPSCNLKISNMDTNGQVSLTATGQIFEGSFGAVTNTFAVQFRYKALNDADYSAWYDFEDIQTDEGLYETVAVFGGLDYQESYVFQAKITDSAITVQTPDITVLSLPVYDWDSDDFRFNVPVHMNATDLHMDEANAIFFGDKSFNGSNFTKSGTWTPVCNAISEPDVAYGSYVLLNDEYCLLNFYFQGTFDVSGIDSIYFSGLPFPADESIRWYGGGGHAMGYAVQGNATMPPLGFDGWTIEGQLIYGRNGGRYFNIDGGAYTASTALKLNSGSSYIRSAYYNGLSRPFYASGTIMYKIDTSAAASEEGEV